MTRTIVDIEGMACGMCEAHINNAIRSHFNVKKVKASHAKKQADILSEMPLDEAKLREIIGNTGYTVTSVQTEPYEKKGFGLFKV